MNFDLDTDDLALRDGIRDLCAKRFPIDRVREGFDADGWQALTDAGVFSLRIPESDGGVGLQMTQASIVFQELGRSLVYGPLVATHLAATHAGATGIVAHAEGGIVEHPSEAGHVLVVGDRVRIAPMPEASMREPLDPLTPVGTIGDVTGDALDDEAVRREGATLTAALLVGIAAQTTELAVGYAKEREQFGKPIGTFQAVKHLCADMLVRAEVARAATDAAAVLLDAGDPDAATAVHTAKLLASEYAVQNAKACIQVHGGMGFVWEVDAHLYLKRAAVLAPRFGGADVHALAVAAAL